MAITRNNSGIFYVVDVETNGFDAKSNDIIELSALKVEKNEHQFEVLDAFDSYINPQKPLPKEILEYNQREQTGITDELLSESPIAEEVFPKFASFLNLESGKLPILVGHNIIKFDYGFLNRFCQTNGNTELYCSMFDTLLFARNYQKFHGLSKNNLGSLFELSEKRHSAEHPKFHTSIADCYATLDVLEYLLTLEKKVKQQISVTEQKSKFESCIKTYHETYFEPADA